MEVASPYKQIEYYRDMAGGFYYEPEYILELLQQRGGGKSIKRTGKHAIAFKETLLQYGWEEEYVSTTFRTLTNSMIQGWTDKHLIGDLFAALYRQPTWEQGQTLYESLRRIGLREDVALTLDNVFHNLSVSDSSYTHVQLLDYTIKYLLGYCEPVGRPGAHYLFHEQIIGTWVEHHVEDQPYSIYNLSYKISEVHLSDLERILPPENKSFRYAFHATSWRYSLNIMERIQHLYGRPCLDFGKNPAFYLSMSLEHAVEWCHKNVKPWHGEASILVFRLPRKRFEPLRWKHLQGEEWTTITQESRQCGNPHKEIRSIRDFDLIYGNMVANVLDKKNPQWIPLPHRPPKKQLVSRSDRGDEFLQSCLMGAIYFQK